MLLRKDNISLRSPDLQDLDFLFEIENNTELWKLSNTISPFSRFDLEQYILQADKDIYAIKQLRFIVELNNENVIGILDIFDFEPQHRRAGVGIIILEKFQNKGFASTVLEILWEYSTKKLNLHQLFCNIESTNHKSLKLFENNGYKRVGIKKDWNCIDGNWSDELLLQKILKNKSV